MLIDKVRELVDDYMGDGGSYTRKELVDLVVSELGADAEGSVAGYINRSVSSGAFIRVEKGKYRNAKVFTDLTSVKCAMLDAVTKCSNDSKAIITECEITNATSIIDFLTGSNVVEGGSNYIKSKNVCNILDWCVSYLNEGVDLNSFKDINLLK